MSRVGSVNMSSRQRGYVQPGPLRGWSQPPRKMSFNSDNVMPAITSPRALRPNVASIEVSKIEQALHDAEAQVLQKLQPSLPQINTDGDRRRHNQGNLRSWDDHGTSPTKLHGILSDESPSQQKKLHPEQRRKGPSMPGGRQISRTAIEQFLTTRRSSSQINPSPTGSATSRGRRDKDVLELRHPPIDAATSRTTYIRARAQRARRAATLIQSAWRGYLDRRELRHKSDMATRIQASFRGYKTREYLKSDAMKRRRRPKLGYYADVVKAATIIQAAYRGHLARKLSPLQHYEHAELAAEIIQEAFRNYRQRRAWLADTTAYVVVPDIVAPNALAAAAFFHGTGVEAVTMQRDPSAETTTIAIRCISNLAAQRTRITIQDMVDDKIAQSQMPRRRSLLNLLGFKGSNGTKPVKPRRPSKSRMPNYSTATDPNRSRFTGTQERLSPQHVHDEPQSGGINTTDIVDIIASSKSVPENTGAASTKKQATDIAEIITSAHPKRDNSSEAQVQQENVESNQANRDVDPVAEVSKINSLKASDIFSMLASVKNNEDIADGSAEVEARDASRDIESDPNDENSASSHQQSASASTSEDVATEPNTKWNDLKLCFRYRELSDIVIPTADLEGRLMEAKAAARQECAGILELVALKMNNHDQYLIVSAFASSKSTNQIEVDLVSTATSEYAAVKDQSDFAVLPLESNLTAMDVRLLPRSKYFTDAECVTVILDMKCKSPEHATSVASSLTKFRQIYIERSQVVQCVVLRRVSDALYHFKLFIVYEDSIAASLHGEVREELMRSMSGMCASTSVITCKALAAASEALPKREISKTQKVETSQSDVLGETVRKPENDENIGESDTDANFQQHITSNVEEIPNSADVSDLQQGILKSKEPVLDSLDGSASVTNVATIAEDAKEQNNKSSSRPESGNLNHAKVDVDAAEINGTTEENSTKEAVDDAEVDGTAEEEDSRNPDSAKVSEEDHIHVPTDDEIDESSPSMENDSKTEDSPATSVRNNLTTEEHESEDHIHVPTDDETDESPPTMGNTSTAEISPATSMRNNLPETEEHESEDPIYVPTDDEMDECSPTMEHDSTAEGSPATSMTINSTETEKREYKGLAPLLDATVDDLSLSAEHHSNTEGNTDSSTLSLGKRNPQSEKENESDERAGDELGQMPGTRNIKDTCGSETQGENQIDTEAAEDETIKNDKFSPDAHSDHQDIAADTSMTSVQQEGVVDPKSEGTHTNSESADEELDFDTADVTKILENQNNEGNPGDLDAKQDHASVEMDDTASAQPNSLVDIDASTTPISAEAYGNNSKGESNEASSQEHLSQPLSGSSTNSMTEDVDLLNVNADLLEEETVGENEVVDVNITAQNTDVAEQLVNDTIAEPVASEDSLMDGNEDESPKRKANTQSEEPSIASADGTGDDAKRAKTESSSVDEDISKTLTPDFLATIRALKSRKIDLPEGSKIEFMTDIEGNLQYLHKLVEKSDVLFWDENGDLALKDSAFFVHGGDIVDKGPGDIRCMRLMIKLKIRYPERVFLIIGNRDSNKVRFMSELEEQYWGANKVPFIKKHVTYDEFLDVRNLDRSAVSALQWMLCETMGCRQTFEMRRLELAELANVQKSDISDETVLQNFKDLIDPNSDHPLYLQHMQLGQMMVQIGDCLFIHGGIHREGIGFVPQNEACSTLDEWIPALNKWMDDEIDRFIANPYYGDNGLRSCEDMIEYTAPWFEGSQFNHKSMIYSDGFVDSGGYSPRHPDKEVVDFLNAAGVTRVIVGHRPQGDTPTVIQDPSGLLIIVADTSFSDPKADRSYNAANFRGDAFTSVVMDSKTTSASGITTHNGQHAFQLQAGRQDPSPHCYVGHKLADSSWIKTTLEDGSLYVAQWSGWTCSSTPRTLDDILSENSDLAAAVLQPKPEPLNESILGLENDEESNKEFLEAEALALKEAGEDISAT